MAEKLFAGLANHNTASIFDAKGRFWRFAAVAFKRNMRRRSSGGAYGAGAESPPSLLFSMRAVISFMSFFGFVNLYAQRVNLSVAMVCMVNHTAIAAARTEANAGVKVRVSACGEQTNSSVAEVRTLRLKNKKPARFEFLRFLFSNSLWSTVCVHYLK